LESERESTSPPRISLWPLAFLSTAFALLSLRKSSAQHSKNATKSVHLQDTLAPEWSRSPIVPQIPPTICQQTEPGRRKHETPLWEKAAGITIAVGTLGLLAVNIFQMRATQKAAEIASDTLKISYRPRIVINGLTTQPDPLDQERLACSLGVLNTGPVAARNVRFFRFQNISTLKDAKKMPYQETFEYPKMIQQTNGQPIGFGIYGTSPLSDMELKSLQRQNTQVSDAQMLATFSVLIQYDDDFSEASHHTESCIMFTLPPNQYWVSCPWNTQLD